LIDTHSGYEEALKDADKDSRSGALAPIFREMIDLRGKAHAELHQALIAKGEKPDDSGSFMATVHKIAIDTRALITGLNEAIPSFISGEEQVVGAYDEALKANAADAKIVEVLMRQKLSLQAQISKMKSLQTA
jgi:uncharacterized protein (TIGR02284 family)